MRSMYEQAFERRIAAPSLSLETGRAGVGQTSAHAAGRSDHRSHLLKDADLRLHP